MELERAASLHSRRSPSSRSAESRDSPFAADSFSLDDLTPNDGILLRVLTLNMALVSPGVATLRYYLQVAASGYVLALITFVCLASSGLVHPSVGSLLMLYGICGTTFALGCRLWIVIALGLVVTSAVVALHEAGVPAPFFILAGFGFCQFTCLFFCLLGGKFLLRFFPAVVECYVMDRIELFLHHLKDSGPYDVVCVQEASINFGVDSFRLKLEEGAALLGLRHVAWTGKWARFPAICANSGLGIFSRHPIDASSVRVNYFREQYLLEWPYVQRGMLFASIQPPGTRRVDICTLHNTASVENTSAGTGCSMGCFAQCDCQSLPERQVLDALEWFKGITAQKDVSSPEEILGMVEESIPLSTRAPLRIVCGDFNFEKHSTSFRRVASAAREVGLSDAVPDSDATFGNIDAEGNPTEWCLTFKMDQRCPRVLDHILADSPAVSGGVVAMCNDNEETRHLYQQASDHRAVEASFLC